jgi:folate-dependent phosphoribosylglycinamide formyltransferase PurN
VEIVKTVLIHHAGSQIEERVLTGWLASFSDLVGVVVIHEPAARRRRRIRRELQRSGPLRFVDVLALRLYYRLRLAAREQARERALVSDLERRFPPPNPPPRRLDTADPNSPETVEVLRELEPDLVLARCRTLLREEVFAAARHGTFVLHPGIAPEYRNSHGCFWALARGDRDRVGATLLRIDAGVDTGPVYGYYSYAYDERRESHILIQKRVVLENLDAIRDRLLAIGAGEARPLDTSGRESHAWGQPWLTAYMRWKRRARAAA